MVKLLSVGRAKKTLKIENFGLEVCSLGPRGDPHMRPRGNPRSDLKATRTDREVGCNDRKRAIPHPRKQRRISLHKLLLLCFLGYSSFPIIASCLDVCAGCLEVLSWVALRSVQVALRSVQVASRSDHGSPRGPCGLLQGLIEGCLEVSCAGCLEVPRNKL